MVFEKKPLVTPLSLFSAIRIFPLDVSYEFLSMLDTDTRRSKNH